MSESVWKFEIQEPNDLVSVEMPRGAEVVHFDVQAGVPCIWARVALNQPYETRWFRLAGTGHPLGGAGLRIGRHIGTVLAEGGALVLHLFEVARP